jgi:hypothetical protein
MATMIRIEQLDLACERLFDAAKERFGSEIDLGALDLTIGEYWTIAPEDAYTCGPQLIRAHSPPGLPGQGVTASPTVGLEECPAASTTS